MKTIHYYAFVAIGLLGMFSCSGNDSEILNESNHNALKSSTLLQSDSLLITPLVVDSTMLSKSKKTRVYSSPADDDEYLSSNMYAIRELPILIFARGHGNTGNSFLSTNGPGKEMSLACFPTTINQKFYLRILPASTGIPYLIYSYATNTPLTVGQYSNNPNNKVLYVPKDNSGSLSASSWDLIRSAYNGYFAIQSEFYLGQSDSKNPWSVFNYTLEAEDDNKLGYAKYTQKPQQEFLLIPYNKFTLDYIEFDKTSATVTKQSPLVVVSYGKNESEERRNFTLKAIHYANDRSFFSESSALKISIANPRDSFYLPTVVAEHLVPPAPVKPEDDPAPVREEREMFYYTDQTQNISRPLKFEINGTAAPNSLIEATSYLENYTVSANYIAHLSCKVSDTDIREIKLKGRWYGTIYTTKRDNNYPNDLIKFFDLDDGKEISSMKSIKLSPIIFK